MTPEQFAYWLQGFVELGKGAAPTAEQWKSIAEHLETVFKKVTPKVGEVSVKINVDTKDAEKSAEAFRKSIEDLQRAARQWPLHSPIWLDEGTRAGFPPGTIIC
jgi:hypothetical protein